VRQVESQLVMRNYKGFLADKNQSKECAECPPEEAILFLPADIPHLRLYLLFL
jgi:hypothetical protein